jgi:hypothetical protein
MLLFVTLLHPEKYEQFFFVATAIKKIGSTPILEDQSDNSKQTYFDFWSNITEILLKVALNTIKQT